MFGQRNGCYYSDVACAIIFVVEDDGSEEKENFRSPSKLVFGGIDVVDHACSAFTFISVPLYDTLGPDAIKHFVYHTTAL